MVGVACLVAWLLALGVDNRGEVEGEDREEGTYGKCGRRQDSGNFRRRSIFGVWRGEDMLIECKKKGTRLHGVYVF